MFSTLLERRSDLAHPSKEVLSALLGGSASATGKNISPDTAISSTAVLACIRRISQCIAMLPLLLYERVAIAGAGAGRGGKRRAYNHPLYGVLHDVANPRQTALEFREMQQAKLMMRGNAYSEIQYNGRGDVVALWPLPVDTRRESKNGKLFYVYRQNGETVALPEHRVMHIKGFSEGGFLGWCLLIIHKEAVALDLSLEEYNARFFGNNAQPSGVVAVTGKLGPEGRKNFRDAWQEMYGGLSNAHRVAVLEEGSTYHRVGVTPQEAVLIEGRTFQIAEVARIFDMPLHMLAELSHATFTNIEHQSLEFVKYTLGPWLKRWEQRIGKDLLTPPQRKRFYAEFLVDGLLRGDFKTRQEGYQIGIMGGFMLHDEARALENRDPLPGGVGAVPWMPLNYVPVTPELLKSAAPTKPEDNSDERLGTEDAEGARGDGLRELRAARGAQTRVRIRGQFKSLLADAIRRVVRREQADVGRQGRKLIGRGDVQALIDWARQWYREEHLDYIKRQLRPVMTTLADAVSEAAAEEVNFDGVRDQAPFVDEYLENYALRHNDSSMARLVKITDNRLNHGDTEEDVAEFNNAIGEWDDRIERDADNESVRLEGAAALAVFVSAGVTRYRWQANADACPLCESIDGNVVGVEQHFVSSGDTVDPADGQTAPLTSSGNIGHPPLHAGCQCSVVPD